MQAMTMSDFDLRIYNEQSIRDGITAFADIAQIDCVICNDTAKCSIIRSTYPCEQTIREFGNYVLDLTVQKGSGK